MPLEITITRKDDKVVLKASSAVVAQFDAEEALEIARKITLQADKILAATSK